MFSQGFHLQTLLEYRSLLLLWSVALIIGLGACSPETLVVGLEPKTLQQHDSPVRSVAFSPDGALLAVGSASGIVRLWAVPGADATDWKLLLAREAGSGDNGSGFSHDVVFSPDSRTLAIGLPDGSVQLWQLGYGDEREPSPSDLNVSRADRVLVSESAICSLHFSPHGDALVTGEEDGSIHVLGVEYGQRLLSLNGHTAAVLGVAFSPDGNVFVSASLDGTVKVWSYPAGTLVRSLQGQPAMAGVAFSPDGRLLATAGAADRNRQLFSTADWSSVRELKSARGSLGNTAFSPDGTMVAGGNAGYEVRWWRVADGELLYSARWHSDSVNSVAFSSDGRWLASGSLDGSVKVWRVP